jgi:hypothetical protein
MGNIKVKVTERYPKNISELKTFIVKEWNYIPKETLENLN